MNANEATLVIADEYGRMAETYDQRVVPRFEPIARTVVDLLAPKPGDLVLDVASGTGLLARLLAPLVAPQTVVAIDLAHEALAVGSHRAGASGIRNIRFEMMDARNIVYRGQLFDAVGSNLGMPNLGYDRTFAEAHRVLKPGGRFVFSEWALEPPPGSAAFEELVEKHRTPAPSRTLAEVREARALHRGDPEARALRDPEHVSERMRDAGFRNVEVVPRTFPTLYPDAAALAAFEASWGWDERELSEMTPSSRAAFDAELAVRLAPLRTEAGTQDVWRILFYRGWR